MVNEDWDAINAKKRIEILKGQTANQAWAYVTTKAMKDMAERYKVYQEVYKELLKINMKMLVGKDQAIPETNVDPHLEDFEKELELERELEEIGAAWKDKKEPDKKLNCKEKASGKWRNIYTVDLTKTSDGYIFKSGEEVLIFKTIPEEDRKNPKMPHYKLFKGVN